MQQRILLKIDVTKIDKTRLYEGKKGIYLDAVLLTNREGQSQYGDDGFIVQSIPLEARNNGERGAIVGNWRYATDASKTSNENTQQESDERVPF